MYTPHGQSTRDQIISASTLESCGDEQQIHLIADIETIKETPPSTK